MKITMYELLGMIKDDKAPKNIKYMGYKFEYDTNHKRYESYFNEQIWTLNDFVNVDDNLNDEVEILEEKKIPEELPTWFSLEKDCENDNIQYANYNFERMYGKINEICDYLKSKGE